VCDGESQERSFHVASDARTIRSEIWDRSEGYYAVLLCAAMGVRWRSEGVLLHRAMASHEHLLVLRHKLSDSAL
jgi:hypothetical protein